MMRPVRIGFAILSALALLLCATTVSLWIGTGARHRSLWREPFNAQRPTHSIYLFRHCLRIESSRGAESVAPPRARLLLPAWTDRVGVSGVESPGDALLIGTALDGSTTYSYLATRRISIHLATFTAATTVLPLSWILIRIGRCNRKPPADDHRV